MKRLYAGIAESISDSSRQGLVMDANIINNDIIQAIHDLNGLEMANGNSRLVDAYTQKITDLQKEKDHALSIRDNMFSDFADNSGHNENGMGKNTEEGAEDSGMSVVSNEDLH